MVTLKDVHQQFASYFPSRYLQPYAYMLSKRLSEGHICLLLSALKEEDALLSDDWLAYLNQPDQLSKEVLVAMKPSERQPFVLLNNRLYLHRYFQYETIILNKIVASIQAEQELLPQRIADLAAHRAYIQDLFRKKGAEDQRTDWQLAAALSLVLQNFTIITGGPGTGKTTTVAKVLSILFTLNDSLKVALAAPTGKAAARMGESLKKASSSDDQEMNKRFQALEPSTLHRLLGYIPDSPFFKHNHDNTLNYDVIIVDESSMIDVALFAKLMDAIGKGTRLILLGDKNQLASVEAGSLFGDLCLAQEKLNVFSTGQAELINSFISDSAAQISLMHQSGDSGHPLFQHVIELMFSHRFKDDSGIGHFSKAILGNDRPVIHKFVTNKAGELVYVDTTYSDPLFQSFVQGYEEYINEKDKVEALRKFNNLRVLCAVREGVHGLAAINSKIEKYLEDKRLIKVDREFYDNRPIIVTSNNYNLGLFNGDIGLIRPDDSGVLYAWFENKDGEVKAFSPGFIKNCETVFAMTIHKSQGSEFNQVLVILPDDSNNSILTRELLYTAVTRARNYVLLQGSEEVIDEACSRMVERASGIVERLKHTEN
ncbi:Exodeoxyribonuclease V alpha chain [Arcticibacter svalbardensis MN12-7]|uniref:RecBCD enzyme subunit RecD n=1 Tax=Arcticibacter svalbardensis MN12-7 TaxID=1150600 RepID=R9GWA9_9SPHI|nr:exodeoxyribonuclease V subunit alpha [Arcticibacter svalbardensis]EOR95815.1 Exodeoxyribonuclease V alpha chain [Arcticibacter svalbardensis MN12-7]